MDETELALEHVSDTSGFETLAVVYMERRWPELRGLIQTGINPEGMPVVCPVDALRTVPIGDGTQKLALLAATTTADEELPRKWLGELPRSAAVCAMIGFAYLQLRDAQQAVQFFNEALMLDAYEPFALYHLAQLRAVQGYPRRRAVTCYACMKWMAPLTWRLSWRGFWVSRRLVANEHLD